MQQAQQAPQGLQAPTPNPQPLTPKTIQQGLLTATAHATADVLASRGLARGPGTLAAALRGRAEAGQPVRVGLVGAGRFGTTVAAQVGQMPGLANMTGLVPDVRGMHEPPAALENLPDLFAPRAGGGLLAREGVVDLANAVAPDGETLLPNHIANGVWAVVTTDNPLLREDLAFYGLPASRDGARAVLYRQYHLCGVEAPLSIAEAALLGRPTGTPLPVPVADVVACAKRDLRRGERLDGSGGATVYGQIERAEVARAQNLLPLGLADGVTLTQDVPKAAPLTHAMVALDEANFAARLRREQDALW